MYIGGSAGAHIASRSIEHVAKYDVDTFGLTDFSGLRLFDGLLICHYSQSRKNDYDQLLENGEKNVTLLGDGDSLIIEKSPENKN
jgi:peptidase E